MPYEPQPYPAWRYHATKPSRLVQNEAQDLALGPEWANSPALVHAENKRPAPVPALAVDPITLEEVRKRKYPCWRYHATLGAELCEDEFAEAKLGPGWFDHPDKAAAVVLDTPKPLPPINNKPAAPPKPKADPKPAPKADVPPAAPETK